MRVVDIIARGDGLEKKKRLKNEGCQCKCLIAARWKQCYEGQMKMGKKKKVTRNGSKRKQTQYDTEYNAMQCKERMIKDRDTERERLKARKKKANKRKRREEKKEC